jgi:hypothetical protein
VDFVYPRQGHAAELRHRVSVRLRSAPLAEHRVDAAIDAQLEPWHDCPCGVWLPLHLPRGIACRVNARTRRGERNSRKSRAATRPRRARDVDRGLWRRRQPQSRSPAGLRTPGPAVHVRTIPREPLAAVRRSAERAQSPQRRELHPKARLRPEQRPAELDAHIRRGLPLLPTLGLRVKL